ncbi:MAG: hypothetical protein ACD_20C00196G0010 [uncultured bacterium]|nr:MAG: hypothetical protein ACD_20C00196G0010 [uncultured bacterium]
MDVSIILVSYNTKDLTKNCLKSIFEKTQDLNFDVWIVDNASKDGSIEMIEEEFPWVKLIESNENLGFGRANNLAIRKTDAKYVFLLNTDTILVNNAIKILFDLMEKPENNNVACCGGQLFNEDLSLQTSYADFPTLKNLFLKSFGLNIVSRINRFRYLHKKKSLSGNNGQQNINQDVDIIIGADMLLRKSALEKAGLFNERFFLYFEEAELCFKLKKHGFKIIYIPEAQIVHLCGKSTEKEKPITVEKLFKTGEILFFDACYGKTAGQLAKLLFIIYYTRYFFLRFFSPKAFQRVLMVSSIKV